MGDRGDNCHPNLTGQVQSCNWSTPIAGDWKGQKKADGSESMLCAQVTKPNPGKLNPRWVECLMGVPQNWVKCEEGNRTDELRALGNGVVPATAHKAWITLNESRGVVSYMQ